MALLAQNEDDGGEVALARFGHDVGRAWTAWSHPHVERPIEAEGKTAVSIVELHRGDAEIEYDAIHRSRRGDRIEVREAVFDQIEPALRLLHQRRALRDCGLVAVDADDT